MRLSAHDPALLPRSCATPARRPSVSWVVHGHGFGHGVGMSQYGAYGYAKHGKGYRFILAHYYTGTIDRDADRAARRPRPGRRGRAATSASAARPAPAARASTPTSPTRPTGRARAVMLRGSDGRPLADCGRKLARRRRRRDQDRRHRRLPRSARGRPHRLRRRLAQRDQRAAGRPVREGRDPERVACLLAAGGAACAGGGLALLRALRPGQRQRLRPLRRHQQPGLRGARKRDRSDQPGRRSDPRARSSPTSGKIAETYFSACSGGHTESIQNVFFGPAIPYLVGVPDPYDYYCPLHSWTLRIQRA